MKKYDEGGKCMPASTKYIFGSIIILYLIIMTRMEYSSFKEVKAEYKRAGKTHEKVYEKKLFEQQELEFNKQGNLLNLLAILLASFYTTYNIVIINICLLMAFAS